jgi:hypothetical protein
MLHSQIRYEVLQSIHKSEEDIKNGKFKSADMVFSELKVKYGI